MPQRMLTIFWSRFGDGLGRGRVRDTDHPHRRLLRARRERLQKMVIPRRCDHSGDGSYESTRQRLHRVSQRLISRR